LALAYPAPNGFLAQFPSEGAGLWLWSSIGLVTAGSLWYTFGQYKNTLPGIKNNNNWFYHLLQSKELCLGFGYIS
jgi:hypothetical protein